MLRPLQTWLQMHLVIGLQQGQRQVVSYVSIHHRQGKLYPIDAGAGSGFKQSVP
jgi:hypothetical protein